MEHWVRNTLQELLAVESIPAGDIDIHLSLLRGHSLKMVTFLARFYRQFGRAPKIMIFLDHPTLETLTASLSTTSS